MTDWIEGDLSGFTVEKHEIPRTGGRPYYPNTGDLNIVLHTTEGSTVQGALNEFESNPGNAPHFLTGQSRILQLRPLSAQGGSLRLNPPHNPNNGCVQIEMVAFSQLTPWLPDTGTLEPTCAVLAWLSQYANIPLVVPYDWPDDCSDMPMPWAANNSRRQQAEKTWPLPQGVWGHCEVPWQQPSNHWDPGCLKRSEMLQTARDLTAFPDNTVS